MKPLTVILLLMSLTACGTPNQAESISGQFEPVRNFMEQEVIAETVPNAIALASVDGKIAFEQAYGKITDKKEASIDTIVRLDSLTKPITAGAILILADEGQIKLSDPVSKYLPMVLRYCRSGTIPAKGFSMGTPMKCCLQSLLLLVG